MVQKVTQTIQVYGASFKMESEEPISDQQRQTLVDAFKEFPQNIVKTLARGRKGEPPLTIVVASKEDWPNFASSPFWGLLIFLTAEGEIGKYSPSENRIYLPTVYYPKDAINQIPLHEIAHAVDDFAATQFLGKTNIEIGNASTFLFRNDDNPSEYFAYNVSRTKNLPDCSSYRRLRFAGEALTRCEKDTTFLISIRYFLKNYPHIPDVDPREQFQTNDLPLELLESKPYKW